MERVERQSNDGQDFFAAGKRPENQIAQHRIAR